MLDITIPVNFGILVYGESDYFGKAGDSVESGCSLDHFDSGVYFDFGDHGSCSVFGESYHSWKSYQHGEFGDCDNLFNMVNLFIGFTLGTFVNLVIFVNLVNP